MTRNVQIASPFEGYGWTGQLPRRLRSGVLLGAAVLSGVLSCHTDTTTGPAAQQPAYWALQLNERALNMATAAPYNSFQLTATPVSVDGTPLSGTVPAHFTANDSSVTVNATGLVTARYATPGTFVTVRLQAQGVTLIQQVRIQVTDTVPQAALATLSIQPLGDDSAKRALDFGGGLHDFRWGVLLTTTARDTLCRQPRDGTLQPAPCGLVVAYTSSNPQVATIDTAGVVQLNDVGHAVFRASTWAYGQTLQDSVTFQVGRAVAPSVTLTLALVLGVLTLGVAAPKKLILGMGAVVSFCNFSTKPVDIVFDQPQAADTASCTFPGNSAVSAPPTGAGNIAAFGGVFTVDERGDTTVTYEDPSNYACRRFRTPGIYHYHSTLFPSDTYEIEIGKD